MLNTLGHHAEKKFTSLIDFFVKGQAYKKLFVRRKLLSVSYEMINFKMISA